MTHQVEVLVRLGLTRAPTSDDEANAVAEAIERHLLATTLITTRADRKRLGVVDADVIDWTEGASS